MCLHFVMPKTFSLWLHLAHCNFFWDSLYNLCIVNSNLYVLWVITGSEPQLLRMQPLCWSNKMLFVHLNSLFGYCAAFLTDLLTGKGLWRLYSLVSCLKQDLSQCQIEQPRLCLAEFWQSPGVDTPLPLCLSCWNMDSVTSSCGQLAHKQMLTVVNNSCRP